MWPKFANSTISMREFDQKNQFFEVVLVQGQLFETGTRYGLKVLLKLKIKKLGVNSYVWRSYRGKTE